MTQRRRLLAPITASLATIAVAGCGGPSTKASVCDAYEQLGTQMQSPHPFSDNVIFRKARELGDEASAYKDSPAVQAEADGLRRIGKSNSTSPTELLNASKAIAGLCGHPLGVVQPPAPPVSTPPPPPPPPVGSTSATSAIDKRINAVVRATKARSRDPAPWATLAALRFQRANIDEVTTTGAYTDKGLARLRAADGAWQRHLALDPKQPNVRAARIMVQAYGTAGLNELPKAVQALQIVIAATSPPKPELYAQLAQLAYQAADNRTGDLASDRAVQLTPAAQRKALQGALSTLKAAAQQAQTPGATTTPTG